MSDVFFDTSVVVAHMRGRYDSLERAGRQNTVFISATVLGELWHGIRKSASPDQGKTLLALFLGQVGVLHPDEGTAEIYGTIAASLERKGAKIPVNDIWIAAAALECGLPLATSDSHFNAWMDFSRSERCKRNNESNEDRPFHQQIELCNCVHFLARVSVPLQ